MMDVFHLLHYGVSAILIFTGAKMLARGIYDIPTGLALGVILAIIVISMLPPTIEFVRAWRGSRDAAEPQPNLIGKK